MKQRKKTTIILPIFGLLFLFTFVQCYTTFKHPEIYSTSDDTSVHHSQEISFIEDCSSCHEQDNPINDAHLQVYDYLQYEDNYNWQYYYVTPWWVDDYYYGDERAESKNRLLPTQRRDFDRRGLPATSATTSPGASGATLSKPTATSDSSPPASSQPTEKKRQARRTAVNKDGTKTQGSTTSTPTRTKKEEKETKKVNKKEKN